MIGTPFYYTQYGSQAVTAPDVANGVVSFPASPVPEELSNRSYYYLWGYNFQVRNITPVEIAFEDHRYHLAIGQVDGLNFLSGLSTAQINFGGRHGNFFNYYRMKLIEGTSFLFQGLLNIAGLAGIVALDNLEFSITVIISYDTPQGNFDSPGQRKKESSIHTGALEHNLQPGKFRFDH